MPTLATNRPRCISKPATFALTLALFCLAGSDASAQSGGALQRYSQRFYGQNFYDHQHPGRFNRLGYRRQDFGPIYGPPQIYSRQYGDEYGYQTAQPFVPRRAGGGMGSNANSSSY